MASDTDSDEFVYLRPGFDLNSLTVPRIRSILVSHDITYPPSAKKAQLVSILETEVLPKAKKILRDRERVRRTSKGITNMPSNHESGLEEEVQTPKRRSRSRGTSRATTRASTRGSTEEVDEGSILPASSTRRRTRAAAKHPRSSDTEAPEEKVPTAATPMRPSGRKSRKSEAYATPRPSSSVASIETPTMIKREQRDGSTFTDDNPFQSGSPVETPRARTTSVEYRRKSGSRHSSETAMALEERRKRRTDPRLSAKIKQEDDIQVPSRATFDIPSAKLKRMAWSEEPEEDDVVAGEEFTPDEQLTLDHQEAIDGRHFSRARKTTQRQGGKGSAIASWFVILTLLSSFGVWWRREKIEIGYCGVGKAHWSLEDTNVPNWANVLEPQCELCPQHAFCYPEFEVRCEQGFVLKPHQLSLGGIVPLPPTCEPDGEKARRIKVVADKAIEELREQRAKWECGEPGEEGSEEVSSPEITATQLREKVGKLKRKGMSDEEFEELWRGAIGEITGREEVIAGTKGPSSAPNLSFTSTSVANLSFSCSIRRHLRLSLLAYRLPILAIVAAVIIAAYVRSQVLARRFDVARVPSLVGMTLDRLATQAALHARGEALEPWISVGQLRDDVLRDELRGTRREKLWKRVRAVVEGNANVRASVREGRGGDVSRVWEWIGGIGGVGGELEGSIRKESSKVRFSFSTPDPTEKAGRPVEKQEMKRWDQNRPIY